MMPCPQHGERVAHCSQESAPTSKLQEVAPATLQTSFASSRLVAYDQERYTLEIVTRATPRKVSELTGLVTDGLHGRLHKVLGPSPVVQETFEAPQRQSNEDLRMALRLSQMTSGGSHPAWQLLHFRVRLLADRRY